MGWSYPWGICHLSQDAVRDSEKITISISEASLICVVYLVGPLADSTDFTVENLPVVPHKAVAEVSRIGNL